MKKKTNLLNFSCWESSENIGTGRQKSFCPLEARWQTPQTHLPPVSPSRGAIFVGQKLTQFLVPSFLLPRQELMDSTVKRIVMVTQVEGDCLVWPGILHVDSELLFAAGWVWAATSGDFSLHEQLPRQLCRRPRLAWRVEKQTKSKASVGLVPIAGYQSWKRSPVLRGWGAEHPVSRSRQDFTVPPAPPMLVLLYLLSCSGQESFCIASLLPWNRNREVTGRETACNLTGEGRAVGFIALKRFSVGFEKTPASTTCQGSSSVWQWSHPWDH